MSGERDIIAAISTAVGTSGIGIIRISGDGAIEVADRVYRGKKREKRLSDQKTHTIHYGYIEDGGEVLDEVLVSVMRAPHTFTAEDTVEINCHGGVYAMRRVLESVLKNGARPAEPGEFTKRAFLNGRIGLSQAEAVMDVIQAENEFALQSSLSQLKGSVQERIKELRERILYQTARIEAALDDPEHISLEGYPGRLKEETEDILKSLQQMIDSAEDGKILKEGVQTVILGKPNAGKSSLLNALLEEDRVIVSDVAGTTRDVVQESICLQGITLHIKDTAGIRDTQDLVERIGVQRAKEAARSADLILYVADSSRELDQDDQEIWEVIGGRRAVILLNKSDLPSVSTKEMLEEATGGQFPVLWISARERSGIAELEKTLREIFYRGEISFNNQVMITNARQKYAMLSARESLGHVLESIELGLSEDFFSIDLLDAYQSLGEITGESVGEDLAEEIFSKFCMGK